jgi:TolA-binding protein
MFSRQDALNRHLRAEKAPCCGLARKESKLFSSPTSSQMSSSQISTPLMESYYMDPFMNYYEQPIEGLQTENQVLRQQLFELQRSSQEKIDRLEDRIKELEMQLMHQ